MTFEDLVTPNWGPVVTKGAICLSLVSAFGSRAVDVTAQL